MYKFLKIDSSTYIKIYDSEDLSKMVANSFKTIKPYLFNPYLSFTNTRFSKE